MRIARTQVELFTTVCLQSEIELKWKLRTNNQCLIIILQHVHKLVVIFFFFYPPSVYCERLIPACVCYSGSITGWSALILNFCPSYFYFFHPAVYIFLKHFPLCSGSLLNESPSFDAVAFSGFICDDIFLVFIFSSVSTECWYLLTQLLLSF